ncbi:MAG: ATP-binding protein [Bacteroidales bacterium]|jgi:Mg-chelatase subunit ChlI|nr:ATP-binding protein [Bacteroidales bacterium]
MSHTHRFYYPFSAIAGQEKMKKALILNAINPSIGGVLIRGQKGTAKSTAVRALVRLLPEVDAVKSCEYRCDPSGVQNLCCHCAAKLKAGQKLDVEKIHMKVVELPLGATEDRLLGTINIEQALKKGEKTFEPGILAAANRNILYVDEVNLLDDHLVDVLLDSAAMGANHVEREGISFSHPAKFILTGTMNPEEGDLRPQLLDRFGLCVEVEGIDDVGKRVEIMERSLQFEQNPSEFCEKWRDEDQKLTMQITLAQKQLPAVKYTGEILENIANLSVEAAVDGHRADIFMLKTAQTIAAFHQRNIITDDDVKEAAELVLMHRLRRQPFQEPQMKHDALNRSVEEHTKKKTMN